MVVKITSAVREYFRYTGISAELEKRGYGSSRAELAWATRFPDSESEVNPDESGTRPSKIGTQNESSNKRSENLTGEQ